MITLNLTKTEKLHFLLFQSSCLVLRAGFKNLLIKLRYLLKNSCVYFLLSGKITGVNRAVKVIPISSNKNKKKCIGAKLMNEFCAFLS